MHTEHYFETQIAWNEVRKDIKVEAWGCVCGWWDKVSKAEVSVVGKEVRRGKMGNLSASQIVQGKDRVALLWIHRFIETQRHLPSGKYKLIF